MDAVLHNAGHISLEDGRKTQAFVASLQELLEQRVMMEVPPPSTPCKWLYSYIFVHRKPLDHTEVKTSEPDRERLKI